MNRESASLATFHCCNAPTVLGWIESAQELWQWAARRDFPLNDADVFKNWHADPEVTPYEFLVDGALVGYGEVWCEPDEPWAELGRLLIAPAHRNRGWGRSLVQALADIVRRRHYCEVWIRVIPTNFAALACYEAAGFVRVSQVQEDALNTDQSHSFAWMRLPFETVGA